MPEGAVGNGLTVTVTGAVLEQFVVVFNTVAVYIVVLEGVTDTVAPEPPLLFHE